MKNLFNEVQYILMMLKITYSSLRTSHEAILGSAVVNVINNGVKTYPLQTITHIHSILVNAKSVGLYDDKIIRHIYNLPVQALIQFDL